VTTQTQAQQLAAQLQQVTDEVIKTVEGLSDAQWKATSKTEGWPVGVVAHHIATSYQGISGMVQAMAAGQPLPPLTPEMIDQGNAQHAKEHANCTREETLALLRQSGPAAQQALGSLTDEQLARTAPVFGQQMSARQAVEFILIGHPRQHLQSITAST
jgi:uncharacterized damage-inducible protein DinB